MEAYESHKNNPTTTEPDTSKSIDSYTFLNGCVLKILTKSAQVEMVQKQADQISKLSQIVPYYINSEAHMVEAPASFQNVGPIYF